MSYEAKGALIPVGGGDDIPLIKDRITIGRRESCDVCLRFPNISGQHVELMFEDECWRIRDLDPGSRAHAPCLRLSNRIRCDRQRCRRRKATLAS